MHIYVLKWKVMSLPRCRTWKEVLSKCGTSAPRDRWQILNSSSSNNCLTLNTRMNIRTKEDRYSLRKLCFSILFSQRLGAALHFHSANQLQGRFIVVVAPRAYHGAFNYSYNTGSGVNFADRSWIWCERSVQNSPLAPVFQWKGSFITFHVVDWVHEHSGAGILFLKEICLLMIILATLERRECTLTCLLQPHNIGRAFIIAVSIIKT